MGCYIIFAQSVTNERAYLLADLCTRLGLGYYSDWANDAHTRQCCAVGPVTKGDKDQDDNPRLEGRYQLDLHFHEFQEEGKDQLIKEGSDQDTG